MLQSSINCSIINALEFIFDKCKGRPEEPDIIASLVLKFTPDLFSILKTAFPKTQFSVTGIFCHQKPIVHYNGTVKNPELGDILFVYIYTDETGRKKHNSLLFQAKVMKGTGKGLTVPVKEEHQLELYSEWPKFCYKRAGNLNGRARDIQPKTINDGAQYLLISKPSCCSLGCCSICESASMYNCYQMYCAAPSKMLCGDDDLATELVNFLKFKSGRTFDEDTEKTKDDWSKMIWDMIAITKEAVFNRQNAGIKKFKRTKTYDSASDIDGYCYYMSEMSETKSVYDDLHKQLKDSNYSDVNKRIYPDGEEGAISIILIESSKERFSNNLSEKYP
jgi:hypothetical protein